MQIYKDNENNRVYEIDNTKLGAVTEPLETGIGTRHKFDDTDKSKMKKVEEPLETGIRDE